MTKNTISIETLSDGNCFHFDMHLHSHYSTDSAIPVSAIVRCYEQQSILPLSAIITASLVQKRCMMKSVLQTRISPGYSRKRS